ncbi:MAG: N-methyl-D-aspartate receptor NMDAR2C subunit [Planctomycetes bacterium]|nr:N-methyl-D-aspartate receptor NMDAR2C subunit [Planctomycetota bacterium]
MSWPEAWRASWPEAWRASWAELGARADDALLETLVARYREPQRHYHTLQHLEECLAEFARARALAERPAEVELALWFHDAIYDVRGSDNEARSAVWARDALLDAGAARDAAERVHELVMATRHDAEPVSADARLLVDVDLAILGAPRERFEEYEAQVRAEYAWVPLFLFRTKWREILSVFLARPRIYSTESFHARLEARARENLARALDA